MPGGSGDYNSLLQAANRQLQPPRGVLTAPYGEQGVQVTMASAMCGHSPGRSYPVKRLRVPLHDFLYRRVLNRHEKAHACIDLQIDRYDLRWEV